MERIAPGWKALGVGGAAVTVLAQTKPEEAISNIAAWAKLVGLEHMPSFLMTPRIDLLATVSGLCVVALALFMWRRQVVRVHHKEFLAQSKADASLSIVVHRASELTAWQPLCETIRYLIYETQWADGQPAPANEAQFNTCIALELRERFARGEIRARGKLGLSSKSLDRATETIPPEFWTDAFVQPYGEIVLRDATRGVAIKEGGGTSYRAIVAAQNDVELVWPRRTASTESLTPLARFVDPERQRVAKSLGDDRARKRKLIDDCRQMIADWDGGIGHKEQRAAMERNSSFLALRSHLPQYFLDHLDKNVLAVIDDKRPDQAFSMAALAHHLDRLEKEWGLT